MHSLGRGVPIAGIAGDQQAALFGQVCSRPGMAKNTYGTGCFMLMNTGAKPSLSKHSLLDDRRLDASAGGPSTRSRAASSSAGAVVQWLRDGLGLIESADVEAWPRRRPTTAAVTGSGFAGLGAPHWDPYARGARRGHPRHDRRAPRPGRAEGDRLQVHDVLQAMQSDSTIACGS